MVGMMRKRRLEVCASGKTKTALASGRSSSSGALLFAAADRDAHPGFWARSHRGRSRPGWQNPRRRDSFLMRGGTWHIARPRASRKCVINQPAAPGILPAARPVSCMRRVEVRSAII